jgi:hypothetical protein
MNGSDSDRAVVVVYWSGFGFSDAFDVPVFSFSFLSLSSLPVLY